MSIDVIGCWNSSKRESTSTLLLTYSCNSNPSANVATLRRTNRPYTIPPTFILHYHSGTQPQTSHTFTSDSGTAIFGLSATIHMHETIDPRNFSLYYHLSMRYAFAHRRQSIRILRYRKPVVMTRLSSIAVKNARCGESVFRNPREHAVEILVE